MSAEQEPLRRDDNERATYPFPPSVPLTPEELAIIRALAKKAAREFVDRQNGLDKQPKR